MHVDEFYNRVEIVAAAAYCADRTSDIQREVFNHDELPEWKDLHPTYQEVYIESVIDVLRTDDDYSEVFLSTVRTISELVGL